MNKYRIVSREDAWGPKYFAQIKFLWFFWEDCRELKNPPFLSFKFENPSRDLQLVENYITFSKMVEETINDAINNPLPKNQKVVKTY
jgi:hypothetical protein